MGSGCWGVCGFRLLGSMSFAGGVCGFVLPEGGYVLNSVCWGVCGLRLLGSMLVQVGGGICGCGGCMWVWGVYVDVGGVCGLLATTTWS